MALKFYKPTSPGRRRMSSSSFDEITKSKPEKSLLKPLKKNAGRNNQGRMTVRHRGGGAKRMLRIIDFKRDKFGVPGRVAAIEYDPNRSARIALIFYADGEKRYILAPLELRVDDIIKSGEDAELKPGNALPMKLIPEDLTAVLCGHIHRQQVLKSPKVPVIYPGSIERTSFAAPWTTESIAEEIARPWSIFRVLRNGEDDPTGTQAGGRWMVGKEPGDEVAVE